MDIQKLIDLFKSKEIDINLSFRIVTKATKLLKRFAIAMDTTSKDLIALFNKSNTEFFSRINEHIADEYDEEQDRYGELTMRLFTLLKEVTKTEKAIADIQFIELVELMVLLTGKIQEESVENFTVAENMTSADTTSQSDTIENENSQKKKKALKV